jgi:hypothetical protein
MFRNSDVDIILHVISFVNTQFPGFVLNRYYFDIVSTLLHFEITQISNAVCVNAVQPVDVILPAGGRHLPGKSRRRDEAPDTERIGRH